jgi:hypothetical protein
MNIGGKTVSVAAIVAAIGGVLAIVGAPLAWASAKMGTITSDLAGLDEGMKAGLVEIVLGVIVLLLVAAWILKVKVPSVAGLPAIGLGLVVAGVAIVVVVALTYFTSTLSDASLKDLSDIMTAQGGSVSFGIGLMLEVVAGVVAIVGGVLGLRKAA